RGVSCGGAAGVSATFAFVVARDPLGVGDGFAHAAASVAIAKRSAERRERVVIVDGAQCTLDAAARTSLFFAALLRHFLAVTTMQQLRRTCVRFERVS